MDEREAHDERVRRINESIQIRGGEIQAELTAAVRRLGEHDVRLDGHDRRLNTHGKRLDVHDDQLAALQGKVDTIEGKVDAMADVHVKAHQAEGIPVPEALRPESPLRLVGDGG